MKRDAKKKGDEAGRGGGANLPNLGDLGLHFILVTQSRHHLSSEDGASVGVSSKGNSTVGNQDKDTHVYLTCESLTNSFFNPRRNLNFKNPCTSLHKFG